MTAQVSTDINVNQYKEDARIFKARMNPTKGLNKAMVGFILLMMVMTQNMKEKLGPLGDDFQEYMFGQNMASLTQVSALFMNCLHEITNQSPEAQKLLKDMHFVLRAEGFSVGIGIDSPQMKALYEELKVNKPEMLSAIYACANKAYDAVGKQLKTMFKDFKEDGMSSSQRFAAGIVSEYWETAADQIEGGDAIDTKSVSAVIQLFNTEGQQLEGDAKTAFQSAKSILEDLKNILQEASSFAAGVNVSDS